MNRNKIPHIRIVQVTAEKEAKIDLMGTAQVTTMPSLLPAVRDGTKGY